MRMQPSFATWPSRTDVAPDAGGELLRRALDRSEREVHELRALVGTISLLVENHARGPGGEAELGAEVKAAIDDHRERMHARLRAQRARLDSFR